MDQPHLIAVMGPTASGKSAAAEAIAEHLDAQLINADAFQVYRGFDIGTSKPADKSKYQLLDILEPQQLFSVGLFIQRVLPILEALHASGKSAVVVGGTGLNIRALFEEYADLTGPASPEALHEIEAIEIDQGGAGLAARLKALAPDAEIDLNNPIRVRRRLIKELSNSHPLEFKLPPFRKVKAALSAPVPVINERIRTRIASMIHDGWLQEVGQLTNGGVQRTDPAMRAIGYLELSLVQAGEMDLDTASSQIEIATRQYAKRQRSWLRTEPNINWVEWSDDPAALAAWVHLNLLPK